MRILVVAPSWIGDTLLAQPLFARLHVKYPALALDALAPPWTAPMLRRMPEIDTVIDAPFGHGELKLRERWRLARALASKRYDMAIVLPNSLKSALIPRMAGIPKRVGFVGESRYGLLNVRHVLDEHALPLMAERYAKLAEAPDAPPARPLRRSHLRVDEANRARAAASLALDTARPIVAFCPGAEFGPAKRWPTRHFATLARKLGAQGTQTWLFGGPKDAAIGEAIRAGAPEAIVNLAGRTDLATAIDLLSLAQAVVSNDSGLMHVAAALDRPLVALYGSSSADHTPPLTERAQLLSLQLECSPCFARVCPLGHFRCLEELLPDRVRAALESVAKTPRTDA
jgi:heptosyltransferase-2